MTEQLTAENPLKASQSLIEVANVVHAFVSVPICKAVLTHPTECASTVGNLDLIQGIMNNLAPDNIRET